MKTLRIIFFVLAIGITGINAANAQSTRKERQQAKEAEIKKLLDAKTYTFVAQSVNPTRGGNRQLTTSEYDFKVKPDTLNSYLPFFGRAYMMTAYNPDDAGIKFTSTKFEYKDTPNKSGGREIYIKPTDTKDVKQLFLSISVSGYATLSITNMNRDPISFYGYIQKTEKEK